MPTSAALRALARKYRALGELRARRDHDHDGEGGGADLEDEEDQDDGSRRRAARETLRALAREFPGCLRELDTLGAEEIERRAAAALRAAEGGPGEPWMAWIDAYHAVMRATLYVKSRLPDDASLGLGVESASALAAGASGEAGVALDACFVQAVAAPPEGRIGIVVLREVARRFGQPTAAIARALFPVRRPSPYRL